MLIDIERELDEHPKDFLRQPIISKTTCPYMPRLAALYHAGFDAADVEKVKDPQFGNPKISYNGFTLSTLQQYYYLDLILKRDDNLSEWNLITDIGGGYGNMCRIAHRLGFQGKYEIYDFPIMHKLQRAYFENHPGYYFETGFNSWKVHQELLQNIQPCDTKKSIMIATHSLNEMPLKDREKVISGLGHDRFIFVYNTQFDGINNIKWFADLAKQLDDRYDIVDIGCVTNTRARVMLGTKK